MSAHPIITEPFKLDAKHVIPATRKVISAIQTMAPVFVHPALQGRTVTAVLKIRGVLKLTWDVRPATVLRRAAKTHSVTNLQASAPAKKAMKVTNVTVVVLGTTGTPIADHANVTSLELKKKNAAGALADVNRMVAVDARKTSKGSFAINARTKLTV
nr:unnamed protein product [Callosobruchus analis]